MFSVNLMVIDFGNVLLNVLAIIGIIIAGGFVVFFLGDLLISIYDPEHSALKIKKKNVKEPEQSPFQQQEKPQELTYGQGQGVRYDAVDYNKALEEEKILKSQPIFYSEPVKPEFVEAKVEPVKEEPAVQSTEDIFAQLRAEEEKFKQEKLKAATEHKNVFANVTPSKPEEDEDDFDFDDIFFSEDELDDEEDAEVTNNLTEDEEEVVKEVNEEDVVTKVKPVVLKQDDEEEAKREAFLEELRLQNEKLKKEVEDLKKKSVATPVAAQNQPLDAEQLEARLAELNERLKVNEKELRAIKKEYIPLSRVRKTLETDKKKLRRKEALVARQKVMLYGVNNIADIDPEKAKKLQEDLDLLDGLRLSVQHCEEVINSSEERFPILETSYKILTRTINTIKKDIEETKTLLAKAKK